MKLIIKAFVKFLSYSNGGEKGQGFELTDLVNGTSNPFTGTLGYATSSDTVGYEIRYDGSDIAQVFIRQTYYENGKMKREDIDYTSQVQGAQKGKSKLSDVKLHPGDNSICIYVILNNDKRSWRVSQQYDVAYLPTKKVAEKYFAGHIDAQVSALPNGDSGLQLRKDWEVFCKRRIIELKY